MNLILLFDFPLFALLGSVTYLFKCLSKIGLSHLENSTCGFYPFEDVILPLRTDDFIMQMCILSMFIIASCYSIHNLEILP